MSRPPASFNPFPGLRSFLADEDYLFFGREEQTMELLERLRKHRFVAVVGTSGSGKSSLVRCGLLSELLGGKMLEAGARWEVAVTHPGGNPLALLTESLLEADLYDREAENVRENLLATLSRSHFGLVEAIKQSDLSEGSNFLLVVDQFEEIFRFNEAGQVQQELANEFVSILLEAANQKEVPIYIVLTMRSDFIGECGQFEGLAEMVNQGEFLIPRLSREQYKRIIEGPIKVAGGQITPRLLQRLLNDIGQHADQLPCLQHALMRTWDVQRTGGESRPLDLEDYDRVGKMTNALSLHADEVYHALAGDRERDLCRKLFQALTVQESENRGVRRPQRLSGLCHVLDVDRNELVPVIDAFRRPGVTFLMPSAEVELTDQTIIDISHESLMRVWTRLRQWVEEEAQAAGIYRRLSESAALYQEGKAGLYRDPELGIALAWRSAMHPNRPWAERYLPGFDKAMQFLDTSREASKVEENARESARRKELEQARELAEAREQRLKYQQRAARKLRVILAVLAVVAVAAGLAFGAALIANNNANQLAKVANEEASHAQASADAADRERQSAETAQKETEAALIQVEASKGLAETNLQKAEVAEKRSREFRYATDMQLAAMLLADESANAGEVLKRLNEQDPAKNPSRGAKDDLRGFEWHYLKHQIDSRALIFPGSEAKVVGAAISDAGELVIVNDQGELKRFDAQTRQETRPALDLAQGRNVKTLALSPDGRKAALFFEGNKVHMVDAATGQETIPAIPMAGTNGLIFSPDSQMLVIANSSISWWDANTAKPIAVLPVNKLDSAGPLSISEDGLTVAIARQGSSNRCFSVFRMDPQIRDIKVLSDMHDAVLGSLFAVALSPNGESVIVSSQFAGHLKAFQTSTGQIVGSNYSEHSAPVSAIAFRPGDRQVATASMDGTVKVWRDLSLQTVESALVGHAEEVTHLAFSAEGKRLVTSSRDQTTRLWELEGRIPPAHLRLGGVRNNRTSFSTDGLLIYRPSYTFGKELQLLDAGTGQAVRSLPTPTGMYPDSAAFSPDNRLLAVAYSGAPDKSFIELWDIDRAERLGVLPGSTAIPNFQTDENSGGVNGLAFSPDGSRLVAGFGTLYSLPAGDQANCPLIVYDVPNRQVIRFLEGHRNYVISVRFSPDGKRLASASYDGTARIWSTETWKPLHILDNPDPKTELGQQRVLDVAFSPDGKQLAVASHEGNAHIFDAATGEHLQTLRGHANAVWCVAFSPDGLTLATGSTDQTVRLWNVATWREILKLETDAGFSPKSLAFSPDGRQLLGAGDSLLSWSTRADEGFHPDQLALSLKQLLDSAVDFQTRIRMLSENPRIPEALTILQRQTPEEARVEAALAALEAHGLAVRENWTEAAQAFDRLIKADPDKSDGWLRTPGLLRLAFALVHEGRPADAARLLTGGAARRKQDGVSAILVEPVLGFGYFVVGGQMQVTSILPGFPVGGLRFGDVILKVNDTNVDQNTNLAPLVAGGAGTKITLTVRHPENQQTEVIEIVKQDRITDQETGEITTPLRAAIDERLAANPGDAGLLELRAALAGQWSGSRDQVADYTLAMEALSKQANPKAEDLARLHQRRGDAFLAMKEWKRAADDYAKAITPETMDEELLANQAKAVAESLLLEQDQASEFVWLDDAVPSVAQGNGAAHWDAVSQLVHPVFQGTMSFRHQAIGQGQNVFVLANSRREIRKGSRLFAHVYLDPEDPPKTLMLQFNDGTWEHRAFWGEDLIPWGAGGKESHLSMGPLPKTGEWVRLEVEAPNVGLAEGAIVNGWAFNQFGGTCYWDVAGITGMGRAFDSPWQQLAFAYQRLDDQEAIDQLVERRPQSVGLVGDLFAERNDWPRALEIYNRGIMPQTADADLLTKRAKANEALENWDAAVKDWERAALNHPDGAKLLSEFGARLAQSGNVSLAQSAQKRTLELYESNLLAEPDNAIVAEKLTTFLLDSSHPSDSAQWTVAKPAEITSENGEEFTIEEDGGIFVTGPLPDRAVYVLRLKPELAFVTAFRIETLPNARLPQGGAGRFGNGNFHLAEVSAAILSQEAHRLPIDILSARVDFPSDRMMEPLLMDGDPQTYWDTYPRVEEPHQAVLSFRRPQSVGTNDLILTVDSGTTGYVKHGLGHFRISLTDDERLSGLAAQLRERVSGIPNPQIRVAAAYALAGQTDKAAEWIDRALAQVDAFQERSEALGNFLGFPEVLAALQRLRPEDPEVQLALARGHVQQGQRHLERNRPTDALAALETAQEIFTQTQGIFPKPKWTILKPVEVASLAGATLAARADDSVLAAGERPTLDTYTFTADKLPRNITCLRLETLPDMSLPLRGSGRAEDGSFQLKELRVFRVDVSGNRIAVNVKGAASDSRSSYDISNAVDRRNGTSWDVSPTQNKPHVAVFEFAEALVDVSRLVVELDSGSDQFAALGRFRLSVTGDSGALESEQVRMDLGPGELADVDVAFGQAFSLKGEIPKAADAFAAALEKTGPSEEEPRILAQFQGFEEALAELAKRRPEDFPLQLALARNLAERGKRHLSGQRQEDALAELDQARNLFTRLSADLPQPEWTVLEPTEMTSAAGATLMIEDDGSVSVSGNRPIRDTYTLVFPIAPVNITAIRLEALRDDRLPNAGPGTHSSGNFVLSNFEVRTPDQMSPIPLRAVFATYEERPAEASLVAGESGWSVSPGGLGQSQTAVFAMDGPAREGQSPQMQISLDFSHAPHDGQPATLGRFRLSATTDPINKHGLELQHQFQASGLMDLEIARGKVHADKGRDEESASAFNRALDLAPDLERAGKILKEASARPGLLERLAEQRPDNARFHNALALHYADERDAQRFKAAADRAKMLYERRLRELRGTSQEAKDLAELLLRMSTLEWECNCPSGA